MFSFYLKGLGLGAGLIMAIGSQNAHVLRMGLRRQHVGLTVLACILCDIVLIGAGVAGMGGLIEGNPALLLLARWGGAAFLAWYGLRAWRSALSAHALDAGAAPILLSAQQALLSVLAVTLLNPHVYLDTVVLLGAIGGQQPGQGKWWFALGAVSNAVMWFCALGFGARLLSPWFAKPVAWRLLDGGVGLIMLALAVSLMVF
ncbi:LysE/ArgO family amino acid transporter [Undibacterium sp.]|jgi:L-lysine exporter family protein LysE/ArgO|uniref:LysE/ArgO family amino acid transporter n=1 Tax=Undibacterium sp. TaxID=1914977 RepID=UPI002C8749B2|nr:LysE/ArgO family amino acid transporter [Undibacterium sp.]HTD02331.1 LysE/ArgO family amino acid transporter [Undibacterium sp.]